MKIGVIVDNEYYTDIRVSTQVEILRKAGHLVYILHFNFSSKKSESEFNRHILISRKKKDFLYATMNWNPMYENMWSKEIKSFIKDFDLEAIHCHDLYMSSASRRAIKMSHKDIPLVLDLHENYPEAIKLYDWASKFPRNLIVLPWMWKQKEKKYLKAADKIITLSGHFAADLSSKHSIEIDRFSVYPNVPNLDYLLQFEIDSNIIQARDKVTFFYFGAVAHRRGIFVMLDAFFDLEKLYPNLQMLIIGPVDKKDMAKFNLYLQKSSSIIHYPWKDISQLPSYVSYSDICVSPLLKNPHHESGVANKIYQYMLFERPLLVSDCAPQANLVTESACGLVYDNKCKDHFVQQAIRLIDDANWRHALGVNAKKAVLTKYNVDSFSENLLDIYRKFGN